MLNDMIKVNRRIKVMYENIDELLLVSDTLALARNISVVTHTDKTIKVLDIPSISEIGEIEDIEKYWVKLIDSATTENIVVIIYVQDFTFSKGSINKDVIVKFIVNIYL